MTNIIPKRILQLKELQEIIQYEFKNINILNTALTHSSYAGSKTEMLEHNERLEFIGDSILNMTISLHLYKKCADVPEGQLTRMRASIVCEQSLHNAAKKIKLGDYLLLSRGEENTGGRTRASILADAFEALVAAIFLDGGINKAKNFVVTFLGEIITNSIENKLINDYKSFLQEYIQKSNRGKLIYETTGEEGPDHSKTFTVALYIDDALIGNGSGRSKKDAQQSAAKNAIEGLNIVYE